FEGADRFEFFGSKVEESAELTDRADGILGLPAPVVPVVIRDVTPERMASGLTGRLFFLDAAASGLVRGRPWCEPGTLFRFVHRLRCLQLDIDIQAPIQP